MKRRFVRVTTPRAQCSSSLADAREYLEILARILVHSGHSPKSLLREFSKICRGLKEPRERWDPTRLSYVADLPHVITHWHSDAQYVDSGGRPIPLPLAGSGPSLTSLIQRVLPEADVRAAIRSLIELKGIRVRGRLYVPTQQYLMFNQKRLSALAHGLTALLGMLRTVEHNIGRARATTLFERTAINPRFPVAELSSFHRRFKALAGDFIWSIDGDMRRRESNHAGGRHTRLGVGIFAFEEPQFTGTHRRGKTSRIRRVTMRRR